MKFDRNKTFPYPVLRPFSDDYIDGEFQANVDFSSSEGVVTVDMSYQVSSTELIEEIRLGNAKFISIVSCRETYFREVVSTDQANIVKKFDVGNLRGEVKVDSYIIVVKKIIAFKSSDINPEFGRDSWQFTPGDVLAQDDTAVFYIDRDLFKPVTSVFDLVKNDAYTGGEWSINLDNDHIEIALSNAMKESIDNARNSTSMKIVLLNSIYFTAAVHAIQRLKEYGSDYEEKKWGRVFFRQIHSSGLDIVGTDAYILAQKLMKYPLGALNAYVFKKELSDV
jgi:hypothetical protein